MCAVQRQCPNHPFKRRHRGGTSPAYVSGGGASLDLRDGDMVSLRVEGPRPATLDGFIVRSGAAHRLEAHIDTDEANACALRDGQLCRVIRREGADVCAPGNTGLAAALGGMLLGGTPIQAAAQSPIPRPAQSEPIGRDAMLDLSGEARRLITEDDVRRASSAATGSFAMRRMRFSRRWRGISPQKSASSWLRRFTDPARGKTRFQERKNSHGIDRTANQADHG